MTARELDFFVSYASPELSWAEWVAWQLQEAGYMVELDAWNWDVGANAVTRMSQALTNARKMVALFSPAYFEPHRFTTDEWTAVVVLGRDSDRLIPVLIEDMDKDIIPAVLRPLVPVRIHGVPADVAKERLLRAVSGAQPAPPVAEPPFPGGAAGRSVSVPPSASGGASRKPRRPVGEAPSKGSRQPGSGSGVYETAGPIVSSPVIADDLVLVGSDDGRLHAVHRGRMTGAWTAELGGGPVRSSPVVDGELVFAGGDDGVYALDLASGERAWALHTDEPVSSRPAVVDNTVYVAADDIDVYALPRSYAASVRWLWKRPAPGPGAAGSGPVSSPCLADGMIYVGGRSGHLNAIDAVTGTGQWSRRLGDLVSSSPVVVDGTVYVGSDDCHVWSLDAATGRVRWDFETGGPVVSSPAVADGIVYVGSDDGFLYAIEATTGKRRWAFPTGRGVLSSPLVADGTVYVGSLDSRLYALDARTGRRLWRFGTGGPVISSPVLRDGIVQVASMDGRLYAVHA
ncbi:toll/interleukin-1 receptor domain-containing protein [Streptomyces sp. AK02-01A]|uniref:toll/interleukin-1 receptor domain-containing protein n=1 Tax=Streptomyces sp. AK02-01A TaxID=3028648 RepID=UPI0029A95650|nr:toll/interleukin-1 receptor domain-containing protein [Streptomyces sp. AK02-01A]MDX3850527.1 toll/interleukin-1 receptor domain-containing protein [Streptomyces sp. AK02-01A]